MKFSSCVVCLALSLACAVIFLGISLSTHSVRGIVLGAALLCGSIGPCRWRQEQRPRKDSGLISVVKGSVVLMLLSVGLSCLAVVLMLSGIN